MTAGRKLKGSRTTIGLSRELRRKLVDLAAQRGERGFTKIVADALEAYFRTAADDVKRREELLALEGSITEEEAEETLEGIRRARVWR